MHDGATHDQLLTLSPILLILGSNSFLKTLVALAIAELLIIYWNEKQEAWENARVLFRNNGIVFR